MGRYNPTTVKEVCQHIGRKGFAYDFPIETCEINPDDLKPLIGQEVYLQTSEGDFSFANGKEHHLTITDVSSTKLYGKVRYKSVDIVDVDLKLITLIEWTDKVVKRVTVEKGAQKR